MVRKISIILILALCLAFSASAKKQVALTFDDGPTPGVIDKLLPILKKENVPVTFFVIGWKVKDNPQFVSQASADGHEIGNHTYSHTSLDQMDDKKTLAEIRETSLLIMKATNKKVVLFRPPHGRLPYSKRKLIEKAGYEIVLWNANADDFYQPKKGMRTAASIAKRVTSLVRNGSVVLMHDNSRQIVEALPIMIKDLKKKGYSFTTVSGLRKKAN
ncbi:MAG: polysaccharide deacetylase family protein [bacterium]